MDCAREERHRGIVGYLTFRIGKMFNEQGKYNKAQQAYQEAFNVQEVIALGSDHLDTLTTQSSIAGMFNKQGKYRGASRIFQHVFEKEKVF
ncbi:tetratricopeptide repeat protein [Wolbachia endosymbiont of Mansonella ozzardi]|nr:tetratricopeptide repeat protein [Wolbachia endosymbiont of Mansonella ozzardi]MCA4774793.1 tetratricopeptide repeat protein [Wolbachia endosymbiont of Mansonella ozzardi]